MRHALPFLAPFSALLAACGGGGGGGGAPPIVVTSLTASPTFFAPGDSVLLLPTFPDGTARIDPDVGPVASGSSYRVGPTIVAKSYTLTVTTASGTETKVLDVPFRYRERVRELPPSSIERTRHGATLLADGRVLMVGGSAPGPQFWSNAEVFDPVTAAFAPVGDLSRGRAECGAIALADGGVLALGGVTNSATFLEATRIERWDPAALGWSIVGNLACNRDAVTLSELPGDRVLIVGGFVAGGTATDRDAEIWEPGTGVRAPIGEAMHVRAGHTATTLASGLVWIAGGVDVTTGTVIATTEFFDPATETFAPGPALLHPRTLHTAVPVDGGVLIVGGEDAGSPIAAAEMLVTASGALEEAGSAAIARTFARAVRLADGRVLAVGGVGAGNTTTDRLETWDPATRAWTPWAARLPSPRTGHSMHTLPGGRVVVLGGDNGNAFPQPTCYVID
ncbi:MAG: galactose oxidase [Planctomycetes bacterium]|nr:galactose oxidase [Planctomycetota bacterium]